MMRLRAALVAVLLAGLRIESQAHPDPSHTLAEIEEHLIATPRDPALHLAKAETLLTMKRAEEARKAIDEAARLDPQAPGLGYARAKWAFAVGDVAGARRLVEEFLQKESAHHDGQRLLRRLACEAADLDTAIKASEAILAGDAPVPVNDFTACAALYEQRGQPGDDDRALAALDLGLQRIGCLTGLHYMACDIEVRLQRYDAALRRIDALTQRFRPRMEFETKRAEVLVTAGRSREARAAYDNALALLEAFPEPLKKSAVFVETRVKLASARDALNR